MDEEDTVVRTIDVYLTQSLEEGGLLYLLQSPLRPPNRPYDVEYSEDVRFKARCCRKRHHVATHRRYPIAVGASCLALSYSPQWQPRRMNVSP